MLRYFLKLPLIKYPIHYNDIILPQIEFAALSEFKFDLDWHYSQISSLRCTMLWFWHKNC